MHGNANSEENHTWLWLCPEKKRFTMSNSWSFDHRKSRRINSWDGIWYNDMLWYGSTYLSFNNIMIWYMDPENNVLKNVSLRPIYIYISTTIPLPFLVRVNHFPSLNSKWCLATPLDIRGNENQSQCGFQRNMGQKQQSTFDSSYPHKSQGPLKALKAKDGESSGKLEFGWPSPPTWGSLGR